MYLGSSFFARIRASRPEQQQADHFRCRCATLSRGGQLRGLLRRNEVAVDLRRGRRARRAFGLEGIRLQVGESRAATAVPRSARAVRPPALEALANLQLIRWSGILV